MALAAGGFAEAGTVYPSADGSRLLTHVFAGQAVFVQTEDNRKQPWKVGRVYSQPTQFFDIDINRFGGYAGILTKKLAGTKAVISNFMDIYMGCLSVAGGPLAWSILGMNLIVAGGKIKQNYDLYEEALEAFIGGDMILQKSMPVFFEHMFVELYLGRIEADLTGKAKEVAAGFIAKKIVKTEAAEKVLSGTIGVFLGKIGEDAMKRTLNGMSAIIREVLLKVIDHKLAGKPVTEDQVELLAKHHVVPMYAKLSQVPLRMDRAKAIVREAANNASTVRGRLEKIAKAVDKLAG
jgi:hypothetical protein